MDRLLLVGCGNMGYAMLSGWISSGAVPPEAVAVVEPQDELRARAAGLGVATNASADALPANLAVRLVVLAVKPQLMGTVLPEYRRFAEAGAGFLSIAAGTRIAAIEAALGKDVAVVRCMPNTPAAIGAGMMVTVANSRVDAGLARLVRTLLESSGEVVAVEDEALMDAVTALSGSGPAYLFHFIECMTAAGAAAGLPHKIAAKLALQTVYGAASLARQSDLPPAELRRQVTSPNGTTAAALAVLMEDRRLERLVTEAVDAARRRSIELG